MSVTRPSLPTPLKNTDIGSPSIAGVAGFNTSTRIATSDLGKPTPDSSGDMTVDRATFLAGLAPATYVAKVSALGSGGRSMWPGLGCTGLEFSRPASGPLTRRESSCMLEGTRAWSRGILPMLDLWNARKVVQRPPTFRAVCAAAAVVGALFVEIERVEDE